jgi:apolipoprotein D and lipocalin family protein
LQPAKGGAKYDIDINFTFSKGDFTSARKSMPQKAWLHNTATNAEWRISPIVGPITIPYKAPYIICDVGPEDANKKYSTTMIGYPDRSYLWLMARKPVLSEPEYDALLKQAADKGYDMAKVQKVPQQPESERPKEALPAYLEQEQQQNQ